jgi:hypothetical protein
MNWSELNIGFAATLKKEVDFAIRSLEEAINNSQKSRTDDLVGSFRLAVGRINEFQLFHHDDDRSLLFEKEQNRLKAFLTSQGFSLTTASVDSAPSDVPGTRSPSKIPKRTPGSGKKSAKPLYAWELAKKDEEPRHPISTDYGIYAPSHTKGIYNHVGDDSRTEVQRHIDYQVILTEDELMTIVARQRAVRAEQHHRQRFTAKTKENRLGIMASGPYMDSKRILKDIYRHDHPEKFTVKGGFRPSGKISFDN